MDKFGFGSWLVSVWGDFLGALFPARCVVCGDGEQFLCSRHVKLPPAPSEKVDLLWIDKVFVRTAYRDDDVETIVSRFKFGGLRELSGFLASEMLALLPDDVRGEFVFVAVPLHWSRYAWRGFNQSDAILNAMAKISPEIEVSCGLRRAKRTRQQARLRKVDRERNLKDAFVWKKGAVVPRAVVLVDDVVASGATLEAAAEALKVVGVGEVYAVVFARSGSAKGNRTPVAGMRIPCPNH